MGHSHISYRGVTPAAVADTLRLLGVEIVFLRVVCVANKAETPFWGFLTRCAKNTLPGVLFLLPALRHHIEALANADAMVFYLFLLVITLLFFTALRHHIETLANADAIVCVCVCACVCGVCVCVY
jgi:hypothetical protein